MSLVVPKPRLLFLYLCSFLPPLWILFLCLNFPRGLQAPLSSLLCRAIWLSHCSNPRLVCSTVTGRRNTQPHLTGLWSLANTLMKICYLNLSSGVSNLTKKPRSSICFIKNVQCLRQEEFWGLEYSLLPSFCMCVFTCELLLIVKPWGSHDLLPDYCPVFSSPSIVVINIIEAHRVMLNEITIFVRSLHIGIHIFNLSWYRSCGEFTHWLGLFSVVFTESI